MSMTSGSDELGFEVEDDSLAPCIRIPWDKTIIRHSITLIRYDHTTRMIYDSKGKLKGFIFVDEESIVRWLAVDGDYLE